jgi:hypothetical protein
LGLGAWVLVIRDFDHDDDDDDDDDDDMRHGSHLLA